MKNQVTASERRGILMVAAIALLVTGGGWVAARCSRPSVAPTPPEVEVILHGDSARPSSGQKGKEKRRKQQKTGKKKEKKTYRERSPLDEPV